jgi:hypothetical protein
MIVAYRVHDRAVFLFGFAKSDLENINVEGLKSAKEIASELLAATHDQLSAALTTGRILEIFDDHKDA